MVTIAQILEPEWNLLLVKRDPVSDVVGVGLEGKPLVVPERYHGGLTRPRTGRILKAGPDAHRRLSPGRRVVFQALSGTPLAMGGDRDTLLLPPMEVLALFPEGLEDEDLDHELVAKLEPPPGHLLVKRLEVPVRRGRIIIPDGVKVQTRSSEAIVLSAGADAGDRFRSGDHVFLAGTVSRAFSVGLHDDTEVTRVTPGMIQGRLYVQTEHPIEREPEFEGVMKEVQPELDDSGKFLEGDPRAPQ
jgi:hypothetical protein